MGLKDRLAGLPVVRVAIDVQQRTKRDAADQFGAAVAFFGFISLVPLVAVAVAIGARVLAGDPAMLDQFTQALQDAIPGLSQSAAFESAIDTVIDNGGTIGLVGGVVLLWTGLRVANALQTATRFVFGLPLAQASTLTLRLWQLASLVLLGTLVLGSVAATSFAQTLLSSNVAPGMSGVVPVVVYVVGGLLDVLLFWAAYRIYSVGGTLSWRDLVPGAILGGIGWSLLKYFGAIYVARQAEGFAGGQVDSGAGTVAVLASIVGLLLLFYIAGRLYVYGAQLNAELAGVGQDEPSTVADAEAGASEPGPDDQAPDAGHDTAEDGAAPAGHRDRRDSRDAPRAGVTAAAGSVAETSLAERFRERGRLDGDVEPTGDGIGREVVPWQPATASRLREQRTRQAAAFASSALAVLTAGLVRRRR